MNPQDPWSHDDYGRVHRTWQHLGSREQAENKGASSVDVGLCDGLIVTGMKLIPWVREIAMGLKPRSLRHMASPH